MINPQSIFQKKYDYANKCKINSNGKTGREKIGVIGFFGELMNCLIDELKGSCQEVRKNGSLDDADRFRYLVWA